MRKHNLFAAATLFLVLMSFPGSAYAAFSYTEKSPEPILPETSLTLAENGGIILAQIGPSTTVKKQSRGDDVLLPLAIELISPDDWKPVVDDGLSEKKVSWHSGSDGDWVKTLEEIGENEGFRFVVNWKTKEVAAGEKEVEDLVEEAIAKKAIEKKASEKKASKKQPSKVAEKTAATEEKTPKEPLVATEVKVASFDAEGNAVTVAKEPWELMAGSLKAQLFAWTKRAGYSLIWDNEYDYRLEAGQTFYGEFEKAVSEVITTLYRNGARIKADIYTKNKVLYVSGSPKR